MLYHLYILISFPQSEFNFFFLYARKALCRFSPYPVSSPSCADNDLASRPDLSNRGVLRFIFAPPLRTASVAMEQDPEDFDSWDASELDHLASDIFTRNLAGNLIFFGNDGGLGLSSLADGPISTSSIPIAESANHNIDSADPLPSLDDFDNFDFFFRPSELPAPSQTTSSMQVPQFGDPTEDEPFRFVNIDADASYTDHHPSESLAPIATAHSVPVAQSTDSAGYEMSSSNYMDLDAPYADMDFSQFLAPTTTTSLVQPTQSADLVEDRTSRIIELDPDPVMTASGPTPTSSEQLPPPVSTDRVLPAEVAQFVNPQTVFDGSGPPDPSYLTPHPQPFASASNEITTTMPTSREQLEPKSGKSVIGGVLVPIQPKPATSNRVNELPPTSEPQDSSLLRSPSQKTSVYRPASSVSRGKRKRFRSPQTRSSDIPKNAPKDCFRVFRMIEQPEAVKNKDQQQPVTKRTRSARTCLRCQMQKLRVILRLHSEKSGLG